jgi:hypothetical protein
MYCGPLCAVSRKNSTMPKVHTPVHINVLTPVHINVLQAFNGHSCTGSSGVVVMRRGKEAERDGGV